MPHFFMVWPVSIFWMFFVCIIIPLALVVIAYEKVKHWFLKLIGRLPK